MPYISYPIIGGESRLPYYVCGVGIDFCQNDIYRGEGFPYPQFVIFVQGEGELVMGKKTIPLRENSAFFIPAHVPHNYYRTGGDWRTWWINFSGRDASTLLETLGFTSTIILNRITEIESLLCILTKIYNIMNDDILFGNYYASAFLYEFILEFYKSSQKIPSLTDKAPNGLLFVIEYIDSCYTDKITMEMLCKCADLSEAHLCRLFKKHLGIRPMEYLNKKRLQKAKELLTTSYISVERVAENVGFSTPSYFGKLFRMYEGCTPSEYRKSHIRNDSFLTTGNDEQT